MLNINDKDREMKNSSSNNLVFLLQAFQKFCWGNKQQQVAQDCFNCKCEPEHTIHPSQCVFEASKFMFASQCPRMHTSRESQQINYRFVIVRRLLLLFLDIILTIFFVLLFYLRRLVVPPLITFVFAA